MQNEKQFQRELERRPHLHRHGAMRPFFTRRGLPVIPRTHVSALRARSLWKNRPSRLRCVSVISSLPNSSRSTAYPRPVRSPSPAETADLLFAFSVCKHVKSNAIVYAKNGATIGIGAGQMSRIDSSRIAAWKAAEGAKAAGESQSRAIGSVVASDAFFPFADGLIAAAEAGVTAVIQPGGSIRDGEIIAAADAKGLAMIFTGMRHFRH